MKRKQKDLLFDTLVTVVAIILGIIIIFPLIYCFLSSFKTPSEFLNPKLFPSSLLYLDNFKNALERGNLLRYTLNSFVIAFVGTAVRMVLSILAAYAFTFYDFKGIKHRKFFRLLHIHLQDGGPFRRAFSDIFTKLLYIFFLTLSPDFHIGTHIADASFHLIRHGMTAHRRAKSNALDDSENTNTYCFFHGHPFLFPDTAK